MLLRQELAKALQCIVAGDGHIVKPQLEKLTIDAVDLKLA